MFTPRPPRKQSTARRGAYAERTSRRPRSTNSVRPWVLNCGSDARRGRNRSIRSRIIPAETRGRLKPFPRLRLDRLQRLEEPLLPFPQLFLLLQEVERLLLQNLDPHLQLPLLRLPVARRRRRFGGLDLGPQRVELLPHRRDLGGLLLERELPALHGLRARDQVVRVLLEELAVCLESDAERIRLRVHLRGDRALRGLRGDRELLPLRDRPREGFHDPLVGARGGQGLVLRRRGGQLRLRRHDGSLRPRHLL